MTTLGGPQVVSNATKGTVLGGAPQGSHLGPGAADGSAVSGRKKKNQRKRKKKKKKVKGGRPAFVSMTTIDRRTGVHKVIIMPFRRRKKSSGSSSDVSDDEEEGYTAYRIGGYHPVMLGDVFHHRYEVLAKLGWGHFSTVWLAYDRRLETHVAMKVVKSDKLYTETANDEIAILSAMASADTKRTQCVVHMSDSFMHKGPYGRHVCMVFEVLGKNLWTLIEDSGYEGFPLPIVKYFAKQILQALAFMHDVCGVIHTDIKPENIVVTQPSPKVTEWLTKHREMLRTGGSGHIVQLKDRRETVYEVDGRLRTRTLGELDVPGTCRPPARFVGTKSSLPMGRVNGDQDEEEEGDEEEGDEAAAQRQQQPRYRADSSGKIDVIVDDNVVGEFDFDDDDDDDDDDDEDYDDIVQPHHQYHDGRDTSNSDTDVIGEPETISEATTTTTSAEAISDTTAAAATTTTTTTSSSESSQSQQSVAPEAGTVVDDGDEGDDDSIRTPVDNRQQRSDVQSRRMEAPPSPPFVSVDDDDDDDDGINGDDYDDDDEDEDDDDDESTHIIDELPDDPRVKLVDFGNACWTRKHFTSDIQTPQYRSPEVILGSSYNASADIWSFACTLFEMVTGDQLFTPKAGRTHTRHDDHLAQMIELLGKFPKSFTQIGKYASEHFNRKGELRRIRNLRMWKLKDVLVQKYHLREKDAVEFAEFLMPMLAIRPQDRATAAQCLRKPWLSGVPSQGFSIAALSPRWKTSSSGRRCDREEDEEEDDGDDDEVDNVGKADVNEDDEEDDEEDEEEVVVVGDGETEE